MDVGFCERSILPVKARDLEAWPSTSSNTGVKISGNETNHILPPTLFIPLLPSSMPLILDHSSKISMAQPSTTALTECNFFTSFLINVNKINETFVLNLAISLGVVPKRRQEQNVGAVGGIGNG